MVPARRCSSQAMQASDTPQGEQDLVDVAGEPAEIASIIDVALLEDDPGTAQRERHVYAPWLYDGVTKMQAIYLR